MLINKNICLLEDGIYWIRHYKSIMTKIEVVTKNHNTIQITYAGHKILVNRFDGLVCSEPVDKIKYFYKQISSNNLDIMPYVSNKQKTLAWGLIFELK